MPTVTGPFLHAAQLAAGMLLAAITVAGLIDVLSRRYARPAHPLGRRRDRRALAKTLRVAEADQRRELGAQLRDYLTGLRTRGVRLIAVRLAVRPGAADLLDLSDGTTVAVAGVSAQAERLAWLVMDGVQPYLSSVDERRPGEFVFGWQADDVQLTLTPQTVHLLPALD